MLTKETSDKAKMPRSLGSFSSYCGEKKDVEEERREERRKRRRVGGGESTICWRNEPKSVSDSGSSSAFVFSAAGAYMITFFG